MIMTCCHEYAGARAVIGAQKQRKSFLSLFGCVALTSVGFTGDMIAVLEEIIHIRNHSLEFLACYKQWDGRAM